MSVLESVRVLNKGDDDLVLKYANQDYLIPAGGETVASWDAACLWFGDPRATDLNKQQMNRKAEYERLTVKWGIYDDHIHFIENTPDIEVYRFNGDRIHMLIEDPTADPVDVFGDGDGELSNDPQEQINQLKQMIREMAEKGSGIAANPTPGDPNSTPANDTSIPEDGEGIELPKSGTPNPPGNPDGGVPSAFAGKPI